MACALVFVLGALAASGCGREQGVEVVERSEDLSRPSEGEAPERPPLEPGERRCALAPQEGCAEGERCIPTLDGGSVCAPAGEGSEGEACDAAAACAEGLLCARGDNGEPERCRALCGAEQGCAEEEVCVPLVGAADVGLCMPAP